MCTQLRKVNSYPHEPRLKSMLSSSISQWLQYAATKSEHLSINLLLKSINNDKLVKICQPGF